MMQIIIFSIVHLDLIFEELKITDIIPPATSHSYPKEKIFLKLVFTSSIHYSKDFTHKQIVCVCVCVLNLHKCYHTVSITNYFLSWNNIFVRLGHINTCNLSSFILNARQIPLYDSTSILTDKLIVTFLFLPACLPT